MWVISRGFVDISCNWTFFFFKTWSDPTEVCVLMLFWWSFHYVFIYWFRLWYSNLISISFYLGLINRAGGLYGRILTEVASTDRTQWGLYTRPRSRFSHTDRLSSVNEMFIIWQRQEQFNSFNVTGLYQLAFCFWTATSRISFFQILLVLFTFFQFSSAFFSHQLFATDRNKYCWMKTVNDFAFWFATFSLQNISGLDAGLDGKI